MTKQYQRYLDIEICKKLVELGCESKSRFVWAKGYQEPFCVKHASYDVTGGNKNDIPAFDALDFLGGDWAEENVRKIIEAESYPREILSSHIHGFRLHLVTNSNTWHEIINEALG